MLAPLGDGVLPLGTGTAYQIAKLADDGGTAQPTTPTWQDDIADMFVQPNAIWFGGDSVTGAWNIANSGAGSTSTAPSDGDTYPFVRRLTTGTTTSGRVSVTVKTTTSFVSSATSHVKAYRITFQISYLSDGTNTFVIRAGYLDSITSTAPTDGAYIELDSNANANIQCVTASNSTRTTTDSGIAVAANTWYDVIITVTNDTSVKFYIAALGTAPALVVTTATNIPSGTARVYFAGTNIGKTAGTTSRDYDFWWQKLSLDRLAA